MKIEMNFGIIITCYIGDYFLTKGLLASINRYMPEIPVCIIQDGDFSIEAELKKYNITHVIKKKDVKNDFLRENCFGSRCTNMVAFWESPFEKFLYIDSDTIVRGDVSKNFSLSEYDFIHNIPHEEYTDFVIKHQYFNFEKLFSLIPEISIKKHHFFNAGVFVATRGMFDMTLFQNLFSIWLTDKKLFGPEPQGFINYMVFRLVEEGEINVGEAALQTLVPMYNRATLATMFNADTIDQPTIVHWAGMKPLYINRAKVYSDIALRFRTRNLRDKKHIGVITPNVAFWLEENKNLLRIYFKGSMKSFFLSKLRQIYVLKLRSKFQKAVSLFVPKSIEKKRATIENLIPGVDYPKLMSETETFEMVKSRKLSVARFAADEFKLCFDIDSKHQVHDKELRYRLKNILLQTANQTCLLSIPTLDAVANETALRESIYHEIHYLKEIVKTDAFYHPKTELSDFVKEYSDGRNVVYVTNNESATFDFSNAMHVKTIKKEKQNLWKHYNPIQKEIISFTTGIDSPLVIIDLGVISGILAYDLSRLGIQVIDVH